MGFLSIPELKYCSYENNLYTGYNSNKIIWIHIAVEFSYIIEIKYITGPNYLDMNN